MNLYSGNETRLRSLKLDEDWLVLDPETESFFKAETGIEDGEELKKHIIGVQEEAYKASPSVFFRSRLSTQDGNVVFYVQVYPYPCIRGFRFVMLKIARLPAYPRVFELLKNRPEAIFLDLGCCSTDKCHLGVLV